MPENKFIACAQCHTLNRVPQSKDSAAAICGKCKNTLFSGHPVALTQSSFDSHVIKSTRPVLVDFWAPWCGPCQMMAPVLNQAAQQLEPRLRVAKVDTEANQPLAVRFGIRSIPTLVLFQSGREIARISGAMNLQQLMGWLKQNMN